MAYGYGMPCNEDIYMIHPNVMNGLIGMMKKTTFITTEN